MFKLTYVVFRLGHPDFIPLPVTGANGHPYGHATHGFVTVGGRKINAHVFRFTQQAWEGGAYTEILKRSNRASAVWNVVAEVEFDAESAAGKLAGDLDAARSEAEDLRAQLKESTRRCSALNEEYTTLLAHVPRPGTEINIPIEEPPPEVSKILDTQEPLPPSEPAAPPVPLDHAARLEAMKFDPLGDEIDAQNALGAGIDKAALPSRAKRREALLAWYAKQ